MYQISAKHRIRDLFSLSNFKLRGLETLFQKYGVVSAEGSKSESLQSKSCPYIAVFNSKKGEKDQRFNGILKKK